MNPAALHYGTSELVSEEGAPVSSLHLGLHSLTKARLPPSSLPPFPDGRTDEFLASLDPMQLTEEGHFISEWAQRETGEGVIQGGISPPAN